MVFGFGKKIDLDKDGLREKIMSALKEVRSDAFDDDVVSLGWIGELAGGKEAVSVELILPTMALVGRDALEAAVKEAVQGVVGDDVKVHVTPRSDVKSSHGAAFGKLMPDGIRNVILIASGKGGVGKSTVASNFAVALAARGASVGLLDADVYGPSVPTMFGIDDGQRPGTVPSDDPNKSVIVPLDRHGIKLMSMGFLVDTSTPMVWRGPMIASACMQLFNDVAWGDLDYLVVDLPPGTGDIQLTISQQVAVTGTVIVSTPQDVALADVIRAKAMFDKVNIPCLGVVENMSYFICDGCDKRHEIFTHGGAKAAAQRLGLDFLAEVPIEPQVRAGGDEGSPVVLTAPASASAQSFTALAEDRTVARTTEGPSR